MKLTDENAETEDKCIFEEIRKIGAFSNETLIEGCKEAEILLQLKEAPKLEKLGSLATEIASIMGADYKVLYMSILIPVLDFSCDFPYLNL